MVGDRILLVFKARHEFLRGNILQHIYGAPSFPKLFKLQENNI